MRILGFGSNLAHVARTYVILVAQCAPFRAKRSVCRSFNDLSRACSRCQFRTRGRGEEEVEVEEGGEPPPRSR